MIYRPQHIFFKSEDTLVHGPILILVPIRSTKDDWCKLIAHKVEIENLYDNLSVGVPFKVFFSCKSAGNDLISGYQPGQLNVQLRNVHLICTKSFVI